MAAETLAWWTAPKRSRSPGSTSLTRSGSASHRSGPFSSPTFPMVGDVRRGATPLDDGRTRFTVWAPSAREVVVEVRHERGVARHRLSQAGDGLHDVIIADAPPGSDYCYHLDGGPGRPDPISRWLPAGLHGPTRVVDPRAFRWSDAGWGGVPLADAIIYEIHVGTFTHGGTFDAAIAHLPRLR